ncbi:MAG: hypothetical protein EBR30_17970 [Cytophagia bacterium]|nr:hypothetical protein [Cytophagia bacterium]NBW36872.1 hypothetical protein [Cytophagia bacterium]
MKTYLTYKDDKSDKFWQIKTAGKYFKFSLFFWIYALICLCQMGCKTENQNVLKHAHSDSIETLEINNGYDSTAGFVLGEDNHRALQWGIQSDTTLPGEVLKGNFLVLSTNGENHSKQNLLVQFSGMDVPDTIMYPVRCPKLSVLSMDTIHVSLSMVASLDFECYQNYEVGGFSYSIELLSLEDAGDLIAIITEYKGENGEASSMMSLYAIYDGQLVSVGEFLILEISSSELTEGEDDQSEETDERDSRLFSATISISDKKTNGVPDLIYKSSIITNNGRTHDEVTYRWDGREYQNQ